MFWKWDGNLMPFQPLEIVEISFFIPQISKEYDCCRYLAFLYPGFPYLTQQKACSRCVFVTAFLHYKQEFTDHHITNNRECSKILVKNVSFQAMLSKVTQCLICNFHKSLPLTMRPMSDSCYFPFFYFFFQI